MGGKGVGLMQTFGPDSFDGGPCGDKMCKLVEPCPNHAQTPHGFALAPGCYNNEYTEGADRRSTLSMMSAFAEVFGHVPQNEVLTNACGTVLGQGVLGLKGLLELRRRALLVRPAVDARVSGTTSARRGG